MEVVETRTLGEGWFEVSRRILEIGASATYDGDTKAAHVYEAELEAMRAPTAVAV